MSADQPDVAAAAARFADARDELFDWYRGHGRDLLWRRTRDPYAVWVSEIMLQQTTVAAVTPFFERFVGRFPTVTDLAAADEDDVLAHWAGLGYYRRARHLHAAAKVVVDKHGGEFPRSVEGLHALPGVGRYTAGAIASFAFGLPAPIVEANTVRLFARLLGEREVVTKSAAQKRLWAFATRIVADAHDDGADPATLNHAVMELGGAVCTPQNPDCVSCAIASACVAYDEGLQDVIPRAAAKKKPVDRVDATLLVRKAGRVLVRRRGPDEWWAGLWDQTRPVWWMSCVGLSCALVLLWESNVSAVFCFVCFDNGFCGLGGRLNFCMSLRGFLAPLELVQ
ncbi:MAG: A/G-specific adenine glycosylase, partial [Planctomycetota bacterium]